MTPTEQPTATVTIEQIQDLQQGKKYMIKVIDHDRARPESRGKWYRFEFVSMSLADEFRSRPLPEVMEDPNAWMINGSGYNGEKIGEREPGQPVQYGFHTWLIDKLVEVTTTSEEADDKMEQWHDSHGDDMECYEYLGWTFEEYGRWVQHNEVPS